MKELTYWAPKERKLPTFKNGSIDKDKFQTLGTVSGLYTERLRIQSSVCPKTTEGQVQNKFHEDGLKKAFDSFNRDLYEKIKRIKGYL